MTPSMSKHALPALGLACLVLAGCAVGPDYREPELPLPDAWRQAAAADIDSSAVVADWWSALDDTLLTALIAEARTSSPNLALAAARIDEARAYHRIAGGGYWPQVAVDGQVARTELAPNGPNGAAVAAGAPNPFTAWEFGLGASWEIDLFGRTRRLREATGAGVEASVEDYRDVMVSLFADVAATYFDVRTLQSRLQTARDNVDSQRETMDVVLAREDAGLVSRLDVTRARSNLANTEAVIPQLEAALEGARNRLCILLGRAPGAYDDVLDGPLPALSAAPAATRVAAAPPADLLRRRPDVRARERQLAAQTARIGVATADLYPSFSLTGALTLQAGEFGDLGDEDSRGWALAPGVRWNLFTGGRIRGQIQVEEARTQQALVAWEQTVLAALAEVESALVALRQEEARLGLLRTAVESSQESVALVHTQYLEGLTDFQSYLDAQRVLFSQQDQLDVSRGQVLQNLVQVNRALGGGWSPDEPVPVMAQAAPRAPGQDEVTAEAGAAGGTEDKEEVDR